MNRTTLLALAVGGIAVLVWGLPKIKASTEAAARDQVSREVHTREDAVKSDIEAAIADAKKDPAGAAKRAIQKIGGWIGV